MAIIPRMPSVARVAAAALLASVALAALAVTVEHGPGIGSTAAQDSRVLDGEARAILEELVGINTVEPRGTAEAVRAMAARFRAAGFAPGDLHQAGPNDRKQNLVVRLRGTGSAAPILLLAHLDVVEARREDWSTDPFALLEKGGYYYGRGTTDMKDMAACWAAALLDMRRRGVVPARDVVLALTADEEGGGANGVDWLVRNRRDLIDAAFCLTEGGGGQIHEGRYRVYNVQAAEKVYVTFTLEATDAGGHSALPRPGNPISRLAAALDRLASLEFPVRLNEVTRGYFARMAAIEGGSIGLDMKRLVSEAAAVAPASSSAPGAASAPPALRPPALSGPPQRRAEGPPSPDAADAARRLSRLPYYNALLRTTCTATRVEGGHAENALPQSAKAWVNCRLLPDDRPEDVEHALVEAVRDPQVAVRLAGAASPGPASPLLPEVVGAVERAVGGMWPGVPVVPVMLTGATDGRILRRAGIPTYGVGAFENIEDNRAHGRDERIGVRQFREERALLSALVTTLSGAPSR